MTLQLCSLLRMPFFISQRQFSWIPLQLREFPPPPFLPPFLPLPAFWPSCELEAAPLPRHKASVAIKSASSGMSVGWTTAEAFWATLLPKALADEALPADLSAKPQPEILATPDETLPAALAAGAFPATTGFGTTAFGATAFGATAATAFEGGAMAATAFGGVAFGAMAEARATTDRALPAALATKPMSAASALGSTTTPNATPLETPAATLLSEAPASDSAANSSDSPCCLFRFRT